MKFVLTNETHVERAIEAVRKAGQKKGKPYQVVIQLVVENKTNPQNRHIHALLGAMAEWQGEAPGAFKEIMKRHPDVSWPEVEHKTHGEWITMPISAADLTKDESTQIIEDLLRICAFAGIDIPWELRNTA